MLMTFRDKIWYTAIVLLVIDIVLFVLNLLKQNQFQRI